MKSRQLLLVPIALGLAGCTPDQASRAPVTTAQATGPATPASPAQGNARFVGRWTGAWDGTDATALAISSISPNGEAVGTYQYMSEAPSPFRSPITGDSFVFGGRARFTFTMRPDGRLHGERTFGGMVNRVVLTRS